MYFAYPKTHCFLIIYLSVSDYRHHNEKRQKLNEQTWESKNKRICSKTFIVKMLLFSLVERNFQILGRHAMFTQEISQAKTKQTNCSKPGVSFENLVRFSLAFKVIAWTRFLILKIKSALNWRNLDCFKCKMGKTVCELNESLNRSAQMVELATEAPGGQIQQSPHLNMFSNHSISGPETKNLFSPMYLPGFENVAYELDRLIFKANVCDFSTKWKWALKNANF